MRAGHFFALIPALFLASCSESGSTGTEAGPHESGDLALKDATITYALSDSMQNERKLPGLSQKVFYSRTGAIRDENSGSITITRPDLNKEFRYQQEYDGKIKLLVERDLEDGELPINRFNEWEGVVKVGTAQVAGKTCTLWNQKVDQQDWTICLTEDNLVLQMETKSKLGADDYTTRHTATEINSAPIDPKMFEPIPQ